MMPTLEQDPYDFGYNEGLAAGENNLRRRYDPLLEELEALARVFGKRAENCALGAFRAGTKPGGLYQRASLDARAQTYKTCADRLRALLERHQ